MPPFSLLLLITNFTVMIIDSIAYVKRINKGNMISMGRRNGTVTNSMQLRGDHITPFNIPIPT